MIGLTVLRALERFGGMLTSPRATVARLGPQTGLRDGLWLTLLYLAVGELRPLAGGAASLVALQNVSGLLAMGASLGRALLPPVVVLIASELVLGHERAHRRGLCLVPLLAVTMIATALGLAGARIPGPGYLESVVGGALGLGLAFWIRPSIRVGDECSGPAGVGPGAKVVGVALLAGALAVTGLVGTRTVARWDQLGPLAPGSTLPTFEMPTLSGTRFTSAEVKGSVGVLVFWATWCGVCKAQMPMYQELHEELADAGVVVAAVDHEGGGLSAQAAAKKVERYATSKGFSLLFAMDDGSMSRDFGVSMIPHTVLVGREGRVRYVHQGRVQKSTLAEEIEGLLSE